MNSKFGKARQGYQGEEFRSGRASISNGDAEIFSLLFPLLKDILQGEYLEELYQILEGYKGDYKDEEVYELLSEFKDSFDPEKINQGKKPQSEMLLLGEKYIINNPKSDLTTVVIKGNRVVFNPADYDSPKTNWTFEFDSNLEAITWINYVIKELEEKLNIKMNII